jgi:hypothetical protein
MGAVATLVAALRYRGTPMGRSWALIGFGMALIAFGEGAWGFQEQILGREVNSPAVADIGYLGFYMPVFLGLLTMPQAPVTGLHRLRLMIDVAIVVGAISVVSFHFLILPLVEQSGASTLGDVISVAYPILDLVIVAAAIVVLLRGRRNLTNASVALLTAGFVCIAFSDSIYTYLSQIGNYDSGSYFDTGWVIGYALITVAGMLAAGRRVNLDTFPEDSHRPTQFWQTAAIHFPLVAVAAILFIELSSADFIEVLIGFVLLVALTLGRQLTLQLEHDKVYHQLEELTQALQGKVREQRMQSLKGARHAPEDQARHAAEV